jgi:DNA-binding LytR/AlgR family response regulator
MRTLIVDDEPFARQVLREEIESIGSVEVVGEAADGGEALQAIRTLRPDVVLLDLQMPGMGGFDVLRGLQSGPFPAIIIVTAYDQHAIQAFEAGAIDYLLKPVRTERLAVALERAARVAGRPAAAAEQVATLQAIAEGHHDQVPRKIPARRGEEYLLLSPDEVLAFQAEGESVWILTARKRYLATAPLRTLEQKLKGLPFQRVHRNALVNLAHIRKMAPLSSQRWLLTLSNNEELVVSKRQAHTVREMLAW